MTCHVRDKIDELDPEREDEQYDIQYVLFLVSLLSEADSRSS